MMLYQLVTVAVNYQMYLLKLQEDLRTPKH